VLFSPGNPATVPHETQGLGQWLCVPPFRMVCLFQVHLIYRPKPARSLGPAKRGNSKSQSHSSNAKRPGRETLWRVFVMRLRSVLRKEGNLFGCPLSHTYVVLLALAPWPGSLLAPVRARSFCHLDPVRYAPPEGRDRWDRKLDGWGLSLPGAAGPRPDHLPPGGASQRG
jgi:hypothetical protein